jgi:hypothetical protein
MWVGGPGGKEGKYKTELNNIYSDPASQKLIQEHKRELARLRQYYQVPEKDPKSRVRARREKPKKKKK